MTRNFIYGIILVVLTYDLVIVNLRGMSESVSWELFSLSCRWPIVPFLLGICFGHFFWPLASHAGTGVKQ